MGLARHSTAWRRRAVGKSGSADDAFVYMNKRLTPCADDESVFYAQLGKSASSPLSLNVQITA